MRWSKNFSKYHSIAKQIWHILYRRSIFQTTNCVLCENCRLRKINEIIVWHDNIQRKYFFILKANFIKKYIKASSSFVQKALSSCENCVRRKLVWIIIQFQGNRYICIPAFSIFLHSLPSFLWDSNV